MECEEKDSMSKRTAREKKGATILNPFISCVPVRKAGLVALKLLKADFTLLSVKPLSKNPVFDLRTTRELFVLWRFFWRFTSVCCFLFQVFWVTVVSLSLIVINVSSKHDSVALWSNVDIAGKYISF